MRIEIRFAGLGGHGVVFGGRLIGYIASLQGFDAAMTVAYSPAQRGGWSMADVIISDEEVTYPYVENPHVLLVTTQERYDNEVHRVRKGGVVIYEESTIRPSRSDIAHVAVPAFRLAEERIGSRMFANTFMVGVFLAVTGLAPPEKGFEALEKLGARALERNKRALEEGFRYGESLGISLPLFRRTEAASLRH